MWSELTYNDPKHAYRQFERELLNGTVLIVGTNLDSTVVDILAVHHPQLSLTLEYQFRSNKLLHRSYFKGAQVAAGDVKLGPAYADFFASIGREQPSLQASLRTVLPLVTSSEYRLPKTL